MIFSYSILNDARKCQKYYEYKHIKQLKGTGPESGDLLFGSAIHLGIQDILEDGGDGFEAFQVYWKSLAAQASLVDWGRFSYENYEDQARTMYRKFVRLHAKKFRLERMEQRVGISLPGAFRIEGTPDFVGEFEGVSAIVDFKTSSYPYVPERILAEEQLSIYSELEQRVNGFKAKKKVYFILKKDYSDPSIQTPLIADFTNTGQVWNNMVSECSELNQRTVFHKNPSNCFQYGKKCPYFNSCW